MRKVPYIVVVGEKEMADETISVRKQDRQTSMLLNDFIQQICAEVARSVGWLVGWV